MPSIIIHLHPPKGNEFALPFKRRSVNILFCQFYSECSNIFGLLEIGNNNNYNGSQKYFNFFLLLISLALVSVVGEESMEQELRPPEEGVDICVSQSELLNKLSGTVRIVHVCPASNQFWYYNCCGEYGDICCFQLQPMSWLILGFLVPVAIGLLALQLLCGLFSNLFKLCCICCCRNPKEMMSKEIF